MGFVEIDPAKITKDNVPSILGALVVEMKAMNSKIDETMKEANDSIEGKITAINGRLDTIDKTLKEHERIFWGPLRISRCEIVPFLWRNKIALIALWLILSVWVSAIDWGVRALQWGNALPPLKLP